MKLPPTLTIYLHGDITLLEIDWMPAPKPAKLGTVRLHISKRTVAHQTQKTVRASRYDNKLRHNKNPRYTNPAKQRAQQCHGNSGKGKLRCMDNQSHGRQPTCAMSRC